MATPIMHRLALMRAFQQYVNGREDRSVIQKFTAKEIRYALEKCAVADQSEMWYHAMKNRLEELEPWRGDEGKEKLRLEEKRWNTIIIGVMAGILLLIAIFWINLVLKFGL